MWFSSLFNSMKQRRSGTPVRRSPHRPPDRRLHVEPLEDRSLPSTFTVTNLLDSGTGSLRAAVAAANANPGADAIDFAVTGTIPLTSGQLDITDSLTINGPGESALTVSGEGVSRVFAIPGTPTVLIANLTVANGYTIDSPGGGIAMSSGTVTLNHVTVSGNSAVGSWGSIYYTHDYPARDGRGGGLYVAGGTLSIDQSTIYGNYAVGGTGGISSYESRGTNGGNAHGGGLYIEGGTVHVNQSTVSSNGAVGGDGGGTWDLPVVYGGDGGWATGGGISVQGGTLGVRQSTISQNQAIGGTFGWGVWNGFNGVGAGGGLYIESATPPLADLDTYTVSNTIDNYADIDPNISGPYSSGGGAFNPRLAISDVSTLEGNTGTLAVTFTVSVSAASTQTITVAYATADGTATAGSDYQAASGTLTFAPGEMTKTVTVQVIGDRLVESYETFVVTLSDPTNATIADDLGVGTILDDEPRISIGHAQVTEGNTGSVNATFTVTLWVAYDVDVTVHYATADRDATAGSDYAAASGTVTIPAGQTSATVPIAVVGDRLGESVESFAVNLSAPTNATIVNGQGFGYILDDEPRVSISDVTKQEGNGTNTTLFTFTVTLSAAYDEPVTVNYATADGKAKVSDNDYVAQSGTITFAPGETTKTITIEVKSDRKREPKETFYVDLFGLSGNALFTKNRGIGTILNDD